MCFSGLEILIFTLEFGNDRVLCQIDWESISKLLEMIEYLLKTLGYFIWIHPLSLALINLSDPLPSKLHNVTFQGLKSHTPFPGPFAQLINILL